MTTPAPTTQFFTGRMPFLPPNRQRQSTEGTYRKKTKCNRLARVRVASGGGPVVVEVTM